MTTISAQNGDIWTIRLPGAKEGQIINIMDAEDRPVKARLGLPMGDEFVFVWVTPEPQKVGARFVKPDSEWLIQTDSPHLPGDRVLVASQKGTQEHTLGESVGENLFRPPKNNYFVKNPAGTEPKWCVRVYGTRHAGDIVKVSKKDGSTQKQKLVSEVQPGIWSAQKV